MTKPPLTGGKPPLHNHTQFHRTRPFIWTMANDGLDTSGDASSDFFSPPPAVGGSVLPRNHDSSWIGARQSPIPSFDDDMKATPNGDSDDDENDATEKYHRALHESLKRLDYLSSEQPKNETAHLLESGKSPHPGYSSIKPGRLSKPSFSGTRQKKPGNIHPLWNGASTEEKRRNTRKHKYYNKSKRKEACAGFKWGHGLLIVSGFYLLALSMYELALWYIESDGTDQWNWPMIAKPRNASTLIRFGGLDVERILYQNEYWRLLSSQFMCGSLPEWIVMSIAWLSPIYRNPTFRPSLLTWCGTFFSGALVGQLWVMAWDREAQTAATATWGTCAVLTCFGIDRPHQRDVCFLAATCLVVLAWWELPCNSVFGVSGAACFGWLLSATSSPDRLMLNHTPRPSSHLRFVLLLTFVLVPALCIAFQPAPLRHYND